MKLTKIALTLVGLVVLAQSALRRDLPRRDEQGLSSSAENAILIGAAVTVGLIVLAFITQWVERRLGQIQT